MAELDWIWGIGLSVAASLVSGVSKLLLRKSWLLLEEQNGPIAPQAPGYGRNGDCGRGRRTVEQRSSIRW